MYVRKIIAKLYSRKTTINKIVIISATNERNRILVVQLMCLNDGYGILLIINQAIININGMSNSGIIPCKFKLSIVRAIDATAPAAAGAGSPEK